MDDAPFRVGYDGSFYSSKGNIAGWEITSDSFYKDTDDYTVYVCPGTNNNKDFLTVHDKNKSSGDEWPFYVHADGWMHCVYGDIGGWNIGKNSINSSYSNTETTEYYVSDSFYSLAILSDSSKIISEFNEKKYSDSSKQKILSSESDSLTISGDSIQGTSRYILYGEETDKSGYSFLLSAINGLQMQDDISGDDTVYSWNGILFNDGSRLDSAKCRAGLVAHYWNSNGASCGTKKGNYVNLTSFSNGTEGKLSELYYKKSNYQIAISRNGVYSFQTRLAINSPTANKRVEVALFKNGSRYAAYSASYATPVDYTLGQLNNYILYLSEGDTIDFRIAPIDGYSVKVNMADILIYALDYDLDGTGLL